MTLSAPEYTGAARRAMVYSQIETGHVLQPDVLAALRKVPRERFVPACFADSAYVDNELSLGHGRYLMEPLLFARLLEEAKITSRDTVLDIGSTLGYSAAVLSHLAGRVVALEEDEAMAKEATTLLADYSNIALVKSALTAGATIHAPYDVIIIEGAIQRLPEALTDQLREGGCLMAVEYVAQSGIGTAGLGRMVRYQKLQGVMYKTVLSDAATPLLPGFTKHSSFTL